MKKLDGEIIKANRFVLINHTNKNLEPQFVKKFVYGASQNKLVVTYQVSTEHNFNTIEPVLGDIHEIELYYTDDKGDEVKGTKKTFITNVTDYELRGDYEASEFDTSLLTITFYATQKS